MTYDPVTYWQAAGADPANTEHESQFRWTETFARQEEWLMAVLEGLEFGSILEVGCGWGRITTLVHDEWPDLPYVAFDLSAERVASARAKVPGVEFFQSSIQDFDIVDHERCDLVLAIETLMHVPPAEIGAAVQRLCDLSSRYVVSLDWAVPLGDTPIAPWNTLFDYRALYGDRLRSVERIGLQEIYVAEVGGLQSGEPTA